MFVRVIVIHNCNNFHVKENSVVASRDRLGLSIGLDLHHVIDLLGALFCSP